MNEIVNLPEVLRSDPIKLEIEKLYISRYSLKAVMCLLSVCCKQSDYFQDV